MIKVPAPLVIPALAPSSPPSSLVANANQPRTILRSGRVLPDPHPEHTAQLQQQQERERIARQPPQPIKYDLLLQLNRTPASIFILELPSPAHQEIFKKFLAGVQVPTETTPAELEQALHDSEKSSNAKTYKDGVSLALEGNHLRY